jgi:hypothetical protein
MVLGQGPGGEYSLIASWITAADSYGGNSIPVFMLARGGRILAEDGSKVRFSAEDVRVNEATGKPVADRIVYEYDDGADKYRVTFPGVPISWKPDLSTGSGGGSAS